MISVANVFRILEEAGRAQTGGREQLTVAQVVEARGGRGSHATRELAQELGVSQRQIQRIVAGETGSATEVRGAGGKTLRFFRELSDRELRRAGARYFRNNALTIAEGSTFALCYHREQDGDEREISGDEVTIGDNDAWLDAYERGEALQARGRPDEALGEYLEMARLFTDEFLDAYGVDAGDVDVCDEVGGQNLSPAIA